MNRCQRCLQKIEFLTGPSGRVIPVQRVRTVYVERGGALEKATPEGVVYVSHFEACPYAGEFSRGGRKAAPR